MFWNLPALRSNEPFAVDDITCPDDANVADGFGTNVRNGIDNQQNEQESTASNLAQYSSTTLSEEKRGNNTTDATDAEIGKSSQSKDGAAKNVIQKKEHQGCPNSLTCGSDDYIERAELLIKLNTALRCHPNLASSSSKNCGLKCQKGVFNGGMMSDDCSTPAIQDQLFQQQSHTVTNEINSNSTVLHSNSTNVDCHVAGNSDVGIPEDSWRTESFQPHLVSVVDNLSVNQSINQLVPHLEDICDSSDPINLGQTKLSLFRSKSFLSVFIFLRDSLPHIIHYYT